MTSINYENLVKHDGIRPTKIGGSSVTDRLKRVTSCQGENVTACDENSGATATLADHLPQKRVSPLDPKCLKAQTEELEDFKRDYENLRSTRIKLPVLTLITPRTKKLLSLLPNPNPAELLAVERIQKQLTERQYSDLYSIIAQISDRTLDESRLSRVSYSDTGNRFSTDSFNIRFNSKLPTAENPLRLGTPSTLFLDRFEKEKQRERDVVQHQPNANRAATAVSMVRIKNKSSESSSKATDMLERRESQVSGTLSLQPLRQSSTTAFHAHGHDFKAPSSSFYTSNLTHPVYSNCIDTSRLHTPSTVATLRSIEKPIVDTENLKRDALINRLEINTGSIQEENTVTDSHHNSFSNVASTNKSILEKSDDARKAPYNCGSAFTAHNQHQVRFQTKSDDSLSYVAGGTRTEGELGDCDGLRSRSRNQIVNIEHSEECIAVPYTVNARNSPICITSVNSRDEGIISKENDLPDNLPVLSHSIYIDHRSKFEFHICNLKDRREKDTVLQREKQRLREIFEQNEVEKQEDEHEAYLSQLCIGVERDLGIVLDKKYAVIKARKRSILTILYYTSRMRESAVLSHWRIQTEKSCFGREQSATLLISRIFRGWFVRTNMRKWKDEEILRARELSEMNQRLCTDARQKVNHYRIASTISILHIVPNCLNYFFYLISLFSLFYKIPL